MAEMSEREKMLNGEPYLAADPELFEARKRTRDLLQRYNTSTVAQLRGRVVLLRELLGRCGERVWVEPPFYCDYGSNIRLGNGVYLNFNCVFLDCGVIDVGANVLFGPAVQLYTAIHPTLATERIEGLELAATVRIGDNCWIGGGAIVCPGVTIGENTTIGAGSVVVKDIPANVLAVGNPCQVVRELK